MKTIVISGAHSNVGKTILAREFCAIIPDAVYVKIGHGGNKEGKEGVFYHTGTPFTEIYEQHKHAGFLIIESNQILSEIKPDCTIYLTGEPAKPSAVIAREKADIIRGTSVKPETIERLCTKLNLSKTLVYKIIWLSGARPMHTSAIILAGGQSTRMGQDKALLEINGESSIKRLYNLLSPFFDEIIVSVGSERDIPFTEMKVVRDVEDGHGPLMGIYSSIAASQSQVNFVIACDIPEVNMTLLFELLANSEEYDIAVPSFSEGQCEPLFAVYKKNVAHAAKKILDLHKRRIIEIFPECKTQIIPTPNKSWYINLNTPGDYQNYLDSIQKVAG